jgi:hypothetical protein
MRHRFIAMSLLLAFAPVAAATASSAQTADDATTTMARARFKEGVEFFDKGDFEQARASFLQAYALKKHPAVLLNLAWSCLKAGHPLEAEKYFHQFPMDAKDVTDKQRADAADGLSQSRAKLGRIQVMAAAGAEVSIDGERVGIAPIAEPVFVEPGAHTVRTKGADGVVDIESVTVLAGEERVARGSKAAAPSAPVVAQPASPAPPPPTSAPAALAPVPAPAPVTTPVPTPEHPPQAATKATPEPRADEISSGKSFFPHNMAPVYIGGLMTLVGVGVAITMAEFKQQALDNGNATVSNVKSHGGTCPPASGSTDAALANACTVLASDNDNVNTDATVANIAIGVAVAGFVGTVAYWIFADKGEPNTHGSSSSTTITPIVGRSLGGLALSGSF